MCGDGGGYEGRGGGIVGHVGWIGGDVGMRSRMLLAQVLRFRICRRRDAIWGTRLPRFYRCPTSKVFKMNISITFCVDHGRAVCSDPDSKACGKSIHP